MIPWTDPLLLGGLILSFILLVKGGCSLWSEMQYRQRRRLSAQRDIRLVICDYRARFGGHREALRVLEQDLESTRFRLEQLAAQWKACQMRAQNAEGEKDEAIRKEEERMAYEAFLREAKRFRQLKDAQVRLRR